MNIGSIARSMDIETMRARATEASALLRLLSNPNRLLIVCFLVEGERSVADMETALGIRQPNLSQQLAELREAGILSSRREAKSVYYQLSENRTTALVDVLHRLFCDPDAPLPGGTASAAAPKRIQRGEAAKFAILAER